jgi:hypothetical protein
MYASWRAKQSLNQCSVWTVESQDWSFPAFLVSWRLAVAWFRWSPDLISSGKQIFQGHGNACRSSYLSFCWVDNIWVPFGHCVCLHPFYISKQKRKEARARHSRHRQAEIPLMVEPFCCLWFVIPSMTSPLNQLPELMNCKKVSKNLFGVPHPVWKEYLEPSFFLFLFWLRILFFWRTAWHGLIVG